MNDNLITAQFDADEKEIASLRSRLAEVEKELEIANEGLLRQQDRLSQADKDLAVTQVQRDEREELYILFRDRAEFADKEAATAQAELLAAKEVVWFARKILETSSFEDQLALKWSLSNALYALEATRAPEEREKT